MAVIEQRGPDASFCGCDISQFKTEKEQKYFREKSLKYISDGLILLIPVMCCSGSCCNPFFHVEFHRGNGLPLSNWKAFYEKVSKDFEWRYFTVTNPWMREYMTIFGMRSDEKTVFYKVGLMPEEPKFVLGSPIKQGGLRYLDYSIWRNVNKELAFNENPKPFIDAFQQGLIDECG